LNFVVNNVTVILMINRYVGVTLTKEMNETTYKEFKAS
jgi:hypothetical protein